MNDNNNILDIDINVDSSASTCITSAAKDITTISSNDLAISAMPPFYSTSGYCNSTISSSLSSPIFKGIGIEDEDISAVIMEKFDKYGFRLISQKKNENPENLIKGGIILGFNKIENTASWITMNALRERVIELEANDDMYFEPFKVIISAGINAIQNDQLITVKNFPAVYADEEEREKILKIIGKAIREIAESIDSKFLNSYNNYYSNNTLYTTATTDLSGYLSSYNGVTIIKTD